MRAPHGPRAGARQEPCPTIRRTRSPSATHLLAQLQPRDGGWVARWHGCALESAFQPVLSITHQRVVGYEALLCATNAAGHAVAPADLFEHGERRDAAARRTRSLPAPRELRRTRHRDRVDLPEHAAAQRTRCGDRSASMTASPATQPPSRARSAERRMCFAPGSVRTSGRGANPVRRKQVDEPPRPAHSDMRRRPAFSSP
ncbi:EAL domain-containing protein [Paraburkholderia lycopersici]|uniref:EAL domain-containing protein n=1 Tax=Paraburkholderia lycopersici TaxID=416944 RepID=A0A1G6LA90_9BURK|nr:EAL domain-containing protein [Paraburkholderia lycopersici]